MILNSRFRGVVFTPLKFFREKYSDITKKKNYFCEFHKDE